jgi:hypothetical protein
MADLSKMWKAVTLQTNVRTVHKLYQSIVTAQSSSLLIGDADANLKDFLTLCEGILLQSGYMSPAELAALRKPLHGVWEVKG